MEENKHTSIESALENAPEELRSVLRAMVTELHNMGKEEAKRAISTLLLVVRNSYERVSNKLLVTEEVDNLLSEWDAANEHQAQNIARINETTEKVLLALIDILFKI